MSTNQEEWLKKQGAKIVKCSTLLHSHFAPMRYLESAINFDGSVSTSTVYHLEVPEDIVKKWEYHESRLNHVIEYAEKTGNMPASYFVSNADRHKKLLQENKMYKDAWQEFQSIRVLLGEDPHWP